MMNDYYVVVEVSQRDGSTCTNTFRRLVSRHELELIEWMLDGDKLISRDWKDVEVTTHKIERPVERS